MADRFPLGDNPAFKTPELPQFGHKAATGATVLLQFPAVGAQPGEISVMRKIEARTIGIDQGKALLFSDFEVGGEMWTGQGTRMRRTPVRFSEKYRNEPSVQVQIDMWDMDVRSNQRAEIRAENISREGFDIVFKTWGDTKVARVAASWTAMGPVSHEDDWDV